MFRNTNSLYKKWARRRALPVFALIGSIDFADGATSVGYVRNAYQMPNFRHVLVNSFGFGGKNVVLALAKVETFRKPVS